MKMKKSYLLVVVVAALLLFPAAARAAERTGPAAPVTVDALVEQGFAAYRAHDYRNAAEKFLRAHTMQPDPNLLFNIGRCYEALGDRGAAIEKYQTFLASPDGDPAGRRRAEEALATLRRPLPNRPLAPAAPLPAPSDERPRSVVPFVGMGLGLTAIATGAVFYLLGVRDHDQVTSAPGYGSPGEVVPLTEARARDLVDSGRTRKLAGGIAMGVGGAAVVASVAALVAGAHPGPERQVAVQLGPGSGSLLLQGRF
jgi:hypothetical protein